MKGTHDCKTCSHAARHHLHCNRITRINNNSSLNRAATAHYYNINHRISLPLVLPQQKDNRLRLERFLIMVRTDIPFLLSATMHYYWKSCCKNSISTQKVLNINIHWCFFASYCGKCVVDGIGGQPCVSLMIFAVSLLSYHTAENILNSS